MKWRARHGNGWITSSARGDCLVVRLVAWRLIGCEGGGIRYKVLLRGIGRVLVQIG